MTAIKTEIRRLVREGAPPFNCEVTVDAVTPVSAAFVRVGVHGDGLAAYRDVLPADAFKVMLPPDGHGRVDFPQRGADGLPYWPEGTRQPLLRAFTVRHFDASARRLEFDVLQHEGLTQQWLDAVRAGDVIGLGGMRHEFHAGDVDEHLIVADASALPAVASVIDSWDTDAPATVYLAAGDTSDRALVPEREGVTVHWIDDASPVGPGSKLERAARQCETEGGRIQAWFAAEASVVRELRRWAGTELGVAREDLHAAAYWKAGLSGTQTDAVHLRRYEREAAAGADVADPDLREKIEFED